MRTFEELSVRFFLRNLGQNRTHSETGKFLTVCPTELPNFLFHRDNPFPPFPSDQSGACKKRASNGGNEGWLRTQRKLLRRKSDELTNLPVSGRSCRTRQRGEKNLATFSRKLLIVKGFHVEETMLHFATLGRDDAW